MPFIFLLQLVDYSEHMLLSVITAAKYDKQTLRLKANIKSPSHMALEQGGLRLGTLNRIGQTVFILSTPI